jgi:hypothetical protein
METAELVGASPAGVSAVKPQKGFGSLAGRVVLMQTTPALASEGRVAKTKRRPLA